MQRAVVCFNQGRADNLDRFLPLDKYWPEYAKVGANQLCKLAEETRSLALARLGTHGIINDRTTACQSLMSAKIEAIF
jgi:hypothetical protein